MTKEVVTFAICIFAVFNSVYGQAPQSPRFTTPNQFDFQGRPCSIHRPARTLKCPVYGININKGSGTAFVPYTQAEIEEKCAVLNFKRCNGTDMLFPDGVCRTCPESYEAKGDGTDLFCEKQGAVENEEERFIRYENPFNCNGGSIIKRDLQHSYRPCYHASTAPEVTIENYYKRDDFDQDLTMAACQANIPTKTSGTVVTQNGITTMYNFTLVRDTSSNLPNGFVQCPRRAQVYEFDAPGWISLYVILALAATILLSYSVYKKLRETDLVGSLKQDRSNVTRDPTIGEEVDVEILETKMRQVGYRNDIFGLIAYITYWFVSWLWAFMFLLVILDEYGMLIGTLCTSVPFGTCSWSWRTGFSCASGCLFKWNWVGGVYSEWPYAQASFGVGQLYATIFILGGIMGAWWVATFIFYSSLKFFFRLKCDIEEATHVVIHKQKEKESRIDTEEHTWIAHILNKLDLFQKKFSSANYDSETCEVKYDQSSKYFVFQCLKYTFDERAGTFNLTKVNVAKTHNEYRELASKGLSTAAVAQIRRKVGNNLISYNVPSVLTSIWDEFFTVFYLYQLIFLFLWYGFFYWLLALTLTVVVIFAGTVSIVVKRQSQRNMQKMSEINGIVTVLRDDKWVQMQSSLIVPGDVLKLQSGDDLTCDCVLVSGRCVMNESSLTGEPTPVPKIHVNSSSQSFGTSSEDMKYTLLSGTRVESVSPGEYGDTRCVAYATGAHTKQGELVRSMLFPPKLRFKFDDHFQVVFLLMGVIGIVVFVGIAYLQYYAIISIYYMLFTISQIFSPLIPAVFSAGQARCSQMLKNKNIFCVELPRTYVSAKVKTFCFDKTGTLTNQGMEFYGVCPCKGSVLSGVTQVAEGNMQKYLGCCQELEFVENETKNVSLAGNEVDIAMFECSGFSYHSTSRNGIVNIRDDMQQMFSLVKRFEFDREVMMMSVIVEDGAGNRSIISKGSYEKVAERCKPETVPSDFAKQTSELAMQGYYVLGVAEKPFQNDQELINVQRNTIERDLTFMGLILFKNDLKSDTAEVLDEMREGNIRNVMITGDNIYTACSIARESRLSNARKIIYGDIDVPRGPVIWRLFPETTVVSPISAIQQASNITDVDLAVTGSALQSLLHTPYEHLAVKGELLGTFSGVNGRTDAMRFLLPYTRIFSRMKPAQKVEVVKLHMERSVTGMCGDGANDAAALRLAHCGVAVATGSSSATIVAPFSSSDASINVAAEVVRQGRCALSAAFAGYKRLIMYGQMLLVVKIFLYHAFLQMSEVSWILIDSFINVGFSMTILLSHSATKLTPHRPTSKLLGLEIVLSLLFQILVLLLMICGAMLLLNQQDWFACKNFDVSLANLSEWWTMGDNFEGAVLGIIGIFQMINSGFVFNHGFEYRKWWFKNYWLLLVWAIFFSLMCAILFAPPSFLPCMFRINCGDASLLARWEQLKDRGFTDSLFLPFSDFSGTSFAPVGCPCNETIAYSGLLDTCENEYINCTELHYNQTFHHNYLPYRFRFQLFGIVLAGFALAIIAEWVVMYGPVRRWLRKRRRDAKASVLTDEVTRIIPLKQ